MATTSATAVDTTPCWRCRADALDPSQPDTLCFSCRLVTQFPDTPKRVKRTQRAMRQRGHRIMDGWVTCPWCKAQTARPEEHVCLVDAGGLYDLDDERLDLAAMAAD